MLWWALSVPILTLLCLKYRHWLKWWEGMILLGIPSVLVSAFEMYPPPPFLWTGSITWTTALVTTAAIAAWSIWRELPPSRVASIASIDVKQEKRFIK